MFRDLLIKTVTSFSVTLGAPASLAADEKHMLMGLERFTAELIRKTRGWTRSRRALAVQIPSCRGFRTDPWGLMAINSIGNTASSPVLINQEIISEDKVLLEKDWKGWCWLGEVWEVKGEEVVFSSNLLKQTYKNYCRSALGEK